MRLAMAQGKTPPPFTESLLSFIPRVSPRLQSPTWLGPYVEILEQALVRPIRVVLAAPPQHGKTETTVHGLIRALHAKPPGRSAYATYNAKRVARVESKARLLAEKSGLDLKYRQDAWLNEATLGSLLWASRKGGLTGEPIDTLLVVDDILKDRQEADSATVREQCIEWFDDVAEPRCHATASIIVMATRWHPDDLSGQLIRRGWPYINLQALADGETDAAGIVIGDPLQRKLGDPLCPERRSKESLLAKQKSNGYTFASLYQGAPRPRGGTIFGEPTYYDEIPRNGYRVGYGIDLAYSKKKHADWSVCVELWKCGEKIVLENDKPVAKPIFYLVEVLRKQVRAPEFTLTLHAKSSSQRGPMLWYGSSTESGVADFILQKVPGLEFKPASEDKLQRSQGVAEAWNEGRVLVPSRKARGLPDREEFEVTDDEQDDWLSIFLDEVASFTGVNDAHDDQVDALAAAHDVLRGADRPPRLPSQPQSRWQSSRGRGFG